MRVSNHAKSSLMGRNILPHGVICGRYISDRSGSLRRPEYGLPNRHRFHLHQRRQRRLPGSCRKRPQSRACQRHVRYPVQVGFRPGLPEVSSRSVLFGAVKSSPQHQKLFQEPLGAIPAVIAPKEAKSSSSSIVSVPSPALTWP